MLVTTAITVAAGAFAPGHLGELTRIVPFELADAVLAEEGGLERRVRLLPSRVGLYFLLAMCLFPQPGYLGVWGKLTAGLRVLGLAAPSAKALRDLRRRIGIAPARRLFEVLAGPLGQPRTPGVMFAGYRTVSFDGCKSLKVPDTPANRGWLGKMNASLGVAGYPVIQLMTLVETGTRALLGAAFGSTATGELDWARQLLHLLDKTMLVLMDRGFDGGDFLAEVAGTGAQFLARLNASRRPPVLRHLPDGSFTSVIGGVKVRVIAAEVTVTCHDGTSYGGWYRLATTLLDHEAFPSAALMALYHERWEHESPTSRSATPSCRAASCARAPPPGWSRRPGPCSPSTRHCASRSPTPFSPPRARTPTGPATRQPSTPPRTSSSPPATSPAPPQTWPGTSAARSWPASTRPAGPASAPDASSRHSAAGPSTRPASPPPARTSPTSPAGPSPPTTSA